MVGDNPGTWSKSLFSWGKTVWKGTTYREVQGFKESLQIIFSVTEKTITSRGQVLLLPEIEVETYWTSFAVSPCEAIDIYHQHGECEQYHNEIYSAIIYDYINPLPWYLCLCTMITCNIMKITHLANSMPLIQEIFN